MKKITLAFFALVAFLMLNIYCSKSQEPLPGKKTTNAVVNDATGGCTCSDNDSSGQYTPTFQAFNVIGTGVQKAFFTKVKNVVTVDGKFGWTSATSTGQGATVVISLPIQSPTPLVAGAAYGFAVFTLQGGVETGGVFNPTSYTSRQFINQSPGTTMQINFNVQSTRFGGSATYHFQYVLVPAQ